MKKEAMRISFIVPASPHMVYSAWLDSAQHSAFTGSKATIVPDVGGKFMAGDGYIMGKIAVLDLGRRIVQSWRTTDFPRGHADSRLEIHFESVPDGTRVTILHSEIPEGQAERYRSAWNEFYFVPMRTYFGKMAQIADKTSAARIADLRANPNPWGEDEEEEEAEPEPKPAKKGKEAKPSVPPPAPKGRVSAPPPPPAKSKAAPPPPAKGKAAPPPPAKGKAAPPPPPAKGKSSPKSAPSPTKPAKASKSAKVENKTGKKAPQIDKKAAKKSDKTSGKKTDSSKKKKKR